MACTTYQIERTGAAGRSRAFGDVFTTIPGAVTAGMWTINPSVADVKTNPRHLTPAQRPEEAVSP